MHNILWPIQLASIRAKDLYNLMNFGIHTTFSPRIPFCFVSQAGSQTCNFFTRLSNVLPINYTQTSLYFILLPVIRYNRCRGRSNPHYFIWYHFKIVICRNFDVLNRNAEIGLENWYDCANIRMISISETCQFSKISKLFVDSNMVSAIATSNMLTQSYFELNVTVRSFLRYHKMKRVHVKTVVLFQLIGDITIILNGQYYKAKDLMLQRFDTDNNALYSGLALLIGIFAN